MGPRQSRSRHAPPFLILWQKNRLGRVSAPCYCIGMALFPAPIDRHAGIIQGPYRRYREHLAERFGPRRIRKVTLHGGFTCPNLDGTRGRGGCSYCDNRSFSPSVNDTDRPVTQQLADGISALQKQGRVDGVIAYFQPFSNTYAPTDKLAMLYSEALSHPLVVGLAIGTRPDCLPEPVLSLLQHFSAQTYLSLEIGLQSAFDATLKRIHRGHDVAEFDSAIRRSRHRGFEIAVHVILGLPGESEEHWRATADHVAQTACDSIKIHPLHVVHGTMLARQFAAGHFTLPSRENYVAGVVDFLERIPASTAVQRITADAPADMLVAPLWCRDKNALLRDIHEEFLRRNSRQGAMAQP